MTDKSMENKSKYWDGWVNKLIRFWFYIQRGVEFFNQFKYVFGAIIALCWMAGMKSPSVVVIIFIILLPIFGLIGHFLVHRAGKVMEWLNIEFSSHWSRYSFELQERQVKAIESVDKNVEKIANPLITVKNV